MADYDKLLQVPRGTKARLESIKLNLLVNTIVYATDTKELGIKLSNGNIEYFKNATDINAIVDTLETGKQDKLTAGDNITIDANNKLSVSKNLENRVSDVETNKVSISTFNQQLLLKQETKPNGVDSLVLGNKINPVYMDDLFITDVFVVANQSAMLALDAQRGDFVVRTDMGKTFVLKQSPATTLANWVELQTTSDVVSVNGKTGAVTIEISDLDGLQLALNAKVDVTTYEDEQQAQDTLIANKVDKVKDKGLSTNDYTNADKQSVEKIPTIEQDILDLESNKVDKVAGKGLSTNDYTTTEKNKLAGISANAEKNRAIATKAEAEAGTINTKVMTPLRVKEAITENAYELTKDKIDTALAGSGLHSTQLGPGASTLGHYSIALGRNASASEDNSTALGNGSSAGGVSSIALGRFTSASAVGSTALGEGAEALGNYSTAIGRNAKAEGLNSIAIGTETEVTEDNVVDFGSNRQVRVNETPVDDRDAVSKVYLESVNSNKQDKLTAGDNITIDANNEISASGIESYNDLTDKPTIDQLLGNLSTLGFVKRTGTNTYIIDTSTYQPLDADLSSIAGLSGTSGLLKKTASNTWQLDTSVYLTAITKTQVEAVLTGTITTHTHNASDIVEDASHRFVTDTEKNTWNAKQNALGFTPENVANKVNNLNTPDNTTFGTTLAVKTYVDTEINALNINKHDIVLISDTAFTITQAHLNKTLIITSSDDVTITVPTQIVENIEKGFFCDIVRYGTGEVTFSGAGIVLNSAGPLSIDAQYIAASLIKIDNNNEWLLIGGRE